MKKATRLIGFLVILILAGSACNRQHNDTLASITVRKKITQFNDTTLFVSTSAIQFGANSVYVLGNETHKIYRLNPHFNLITNIGRYGKGPGEFTEVTDINFANDSLYIYDRAQAKIIIYDENNHFVREIASPDNSGFDIAVDAKSHIFLSTPDSKHPITELDAHGHIIRSFGQNTVSQNSQHFERNELMLFVKDSMLVAVSKSEPFVAVYNLYGKLLNKTKVAPGQIRQLITYVKKKNTGPHKHPHFKFLEILFNDAAIYNNALYLMSTPEIAAKTNPPKKRFTLIFKYYLKPNGALIFKKGFKLFFKDHKKNCLDFD